MNLKQGLMLVPASSERDKCRGEYRRNRKRVHALGSRLEFALRVRQRGHILPQDDRLLDHPPEHLLVYIKIGMAVVQLNDGE